MAVRSLSIATSPVLLGRADGNTAGGRSSGPVVVNSERVLPAMPFWHQVTDDALAPYLRAIGRRGLGESGDGWMASTRS